MDESKKPRICEILEVEVGEEWSYHYSGTEYKFRVRQLDGYARWEAFIAYPHGAPKAWTDVVNGFASSYLLTIMDNPDLIQHKPRWTRDDVEDAKAVRKMFPSAEYLYKAENNDSVAIGVKYEVEISRESRSVWTDAPICPSLRPGEKIDLDEILEAEK